MCISGYLRTFQIALLVSLSVRWAYALMTAIGVMDTRIVRIAAMNYLAAMAVSHKTIQYIIGSHYDL